MLESCAAGRNLKCATCDRSAAKKLGVSVFQSDLLPYKWLAHAELAHCPAYLDWIVHHEVVYTTDAAGGSK